MPRIQVVLAADRRCVIGCAVSLRSMLEHVSPGHTLDVRLILHGVDASDVDRLVSIVADAEADAVCSVAEFNPTEAGHLQRSKAISRMAYARLFLDELLADWGGRCVYFDCDIMFERDIAELHTVPLEGHPVAAVDNAEWDDSAAYQARLGLAKPEYFNSGLLVIDLDRWREEGVSGRARDFAMEAGDRLILHDQDALNGALQGSWLSLPLHWNVWVIHPDLKQDDEAVFHFMGSPKPWHADYSGLYAEKFFAYVDRTPYRGWRPWNPGGLGAAIAAMRRRIPYPPSVLRVLRTRLASAAQRTGP